MESSEQHRVSQFINDIHSIDAEKGDIIELIRSLFKNESSELSEEIKYGGLVYFKAGSLIGGIFPYKKHISIEFSCGADFADPLELLEGKGKRRRHLKIHVREDIDNKNSSFYISQSMSVACDAK